MYVRMHKCTTMMWVYINVMVWMLLLSCLLNESLGFASSVSLILFFLWPFPRYRVLFSATSHLYHSFSRLICITLFQDWISFSCCSLPLGGSRCSHLFLCVYLPERVYLHVCLTKNTFWCARILFVCVSIYRCTSICTDMYLNICLHEYVPIPAYVNIHL